MNSMVVLVLSTVFPLEFRYPEKANVHHPYHIEIENYLHLLTYRTLLEVIAASLGFI